MLCYIALSEQIGACRLIDFETVSPKKLGTILAMDIFLLILLGFALGFFGTGLVLDKGIRGADLVTFLLIVVLSMSLGFHLSTIINS
jgi:hypothetical protein